MVQPDLENTTFLFQKPVVKREETGSSSKVGLDVALRELDRYQAMTDREKLEFNMAESMLELNMAECTGKLEFNMAAERKLEFNMAKCKLDFNMAERKLHMADSKVEFNMTKSKLGVYHGGK